MSTLLVSDLIELVQRDYDLNQRAVSKTARFQAANLLRRLGSHPAAELTFQAIEEYKLQRIASGRARCTVNNELSLLKKGFAIAVAARLLEKEHLPAIMLLRRGRPRTGFIRICDFLRIAEELRPDVRDVAEFAYWSGWRRGEVFGLTWARTDDEWLWCYDKNGDTKYAPRQARLADVLERRAERRIEGCPWVFHRRGRQIRSIREGWNSAVRRAGLERAVLFHDLRRSFCRNAIRAGVDRDTVMKLSGHRTDDVFRRYNIQDHDDLVDAAGKLEAFRDSMRPRRT